MRRVLIIAGEPSGDLHGAFLMRSMKTLVPGLDFRGIGGSRMMDEGLLAIRHVRDMNFMGFTEVIRHLPFIRRTFGDLEQLIGSWQPELAILIDYPGFNLRLAPFLKKSGIPVMYYISPQVWAWHKKRVRHVKEYVDRMVVLFAFEQDFYRKYGIEADFVGHPLIDIVKPTMEREPFRKRLSADSLPLVGLLPGSRVQEIQRILPRMAGAVRLLDRNRGVVAALGCSGEIEDDIYRKHIEGTGIVPLRGETYDLMAHADALMVTSGTATLEAGILGTPMVIVYRTSPLTYAIGKMLVNIENIGMINIVAGSRVVPELWQGEVTAGNIASAVELFLDNPERARAARYSLGIAREKLGGSGASDRAAQVAVSLLA